MARGNEVSQLASELDIARSVLADLVSGGCSRPSASVSWMRSPALAITEDAFQAALQLALRIPALATLRPITPDYQPPQL